MVDEAAAAIADAQRRYDQATAWLERSEVGQVRNLHVLLDEDLQHLATAKRDLTRAANKLDGLGRALTPKARTRRHHLEIDLSTAKRTLDERTHAVERLRTSLARLPSLDDIDRVRDQQRQARRELEGLGRPIEPRHRFPRIVRGR